MLRIWLCIIALLLTSVSGSGLLPAVAMDAVCAQSCPDDDERGQCAPDCADCVCCAHARPVMLARSATLLRSHQDTVLMEHEAQEPPSADASDILHVPIALLA